MVKKVVISAIVIAKNAQEKIERCLKSLKWADEIVLVDSGSTDSTLKIARRFKPKIYISKGKNYSDWRNYGKDKALGEFIFYLDSDEQVSDELADEILNKIRNWDEGIACYAIPRKNIVFGKILYHGGWYPDYVIRLFDKKKLVGWEGELHERPVYEGEMSYLKSPIIHWKEKTLKEMVDKTNIWSGVEAKLMFDAGHPPMNFFRFASAALREFFYRFVKKLGFLDGPEGIIFNLYQVYSRCISYIKLWEMQIKKNNLPQNTHSKI